MEKKVIEWFQEAKKEGLAWAMYAIENCDNPDSLVSSLKSALVHGFEWSNPDNLPYQEYKMNLDYWKNIDKGLEKKEKGLKDSQDKPSFLEIYPPFLVEMAKRLNSNKESNGGKYPLFNFKEKIDPMLITDASFRHLLDILTIQAYPESTPMSEEDIKDHVIALGVNAMILYYQLTNKQ